jgi:hypothetical protein
LQNIITTNTLTERFNMNILYTELMGSSKLDSSTKNLLSDFKNRLKDARTFKEVIKNLIRNVFLIEIVNDAITSTKFDVRWSDRLNQDPRYATFKECLEIFNLQLNILINFSDEYLTLLKEFLNIKSVPYELPLDYTVRDLKKIHRIDNFTWLSLDELKDLVNTRKLLMYFDESDDTIFFKQVSSDKIQTKAYLTDRVLTGTHKTNREKRWEAHPESVHFALRRECQKIEQKLLIQLSRFDSAPTSIVERLVKYNLLEKDFNIFTCPILGMKLEYTKFKSEILQTDHGRSSFQVGHMRPLKSITDQNFGHTALNISWISQDGNRVQGHLSLEEVDEMLYYACKARGWIQTEEETPYKSVKRSE